MSSYLPSFLKATPPSPFVDHTKIQAPQIYPENSWHGIQRGDINVAQKEVDDGILTNRFVGGSNFPYTAGPDSVAVKNNPYRYKTHKALNQVCGTPGASARLSCVADNSLQRSREYKKGPWYNPYSYGDGSEILMHNERLLDGNIQQLLEAYPQWGLQNIGKIAAGMRKAIGALQERGGTHRDMHSGQFMYKYVSKGGDFVVNGKNAIIVLHDMDQVIVDKNYDRKGEHVKQYMKAVVDLLDIHLLEKIPDAPPAWHAKLNQLYDIMSPLHTHEFVYAGLEFADKNLIETTYAQKGYENDEMIPWDQETYNAALWKFDDVLNNPTVPKPEAPVQGLAVKGKKFKQPGDQRRFNDMHVDTASSDIVSGLTAFNAHHLEQVYKFKYGLSDVKVTLFKNYYSHTPVFVVTWPSTEFAADSKYGVDAFAFADFKLEYDAMKAKYGEVSNAVPLSSFPSLVTAIKSGKYGRANNMEALLKSPVGQFLKATAPIFESREASWSEWLGLMPTQVAGDVS